MEILDYNVIKNNNFDRTKSYFSCYYKSIILFTDYDAKSYNLLLDIMMKLKVMNFM